MRTMIIPVIHYIDDEQAMRNAERAFEAGCDGVMVIDMNGRNKWLAGIAKKIKACWPDRLVGINMLGSRPVDAMLYSLMSGLDMTWTDEQVTHSEGAPWREASILTNMMTDHPEHLLFVAVAFKYQRHEPCPSEAAARASDMGFIPTTSGAATGSPADVGTIALMRRHLGEDSRLAVASGITPENAHLYAPHLSHILVATGVSVDEDELDTDRMRALVAACGVG